MDTATQCQKVVERMKSESLARIQVDRRNSRVKFDKWIDDIIGEVQEPECSKKEEEMRGFKAFLIITKSLDLAFMLAVLLLVYVIKSVAFYPFLAFTFIEILILSVAVFHGRTPSLSVLLIYTALEIVKALAAITLALVTVLYDHDKHCAVTECKTFDFTPVERFRFFWFLISKAAFSMFLCLVAMAHSPQLHDYNAEDDTAPLSF